MNSLAKSNPDKYYLLLQVGGLINTMNVVLSEDTKIPDETYSGSIESLKELKLTLKPKVDKLVKWVNDINDLTNENAKKINDRRKLLGITDYKVAPIEDYDGITKEMIDRSNLDDDGEYFTSEDRCDFYSMTKIKQRFNKTVRRLKNKN